MSSRPKIPKYARNKNVLVVGGSGSGKTRFFIKPNLLQILGISRPTVYELLKKNEFRWIQIGTKYRISKKSFDEWLDQKAEKM